LVSVLAGTSAEICYLPETATHGLDAVYAHDASLMTDRGAICLRMGKPQRAGEPTLHRAWYESAGIPVLGEIEAPGTAEAGDAVWLDAATLLVGRGYRTNASGIEQLRSLLSAYGIAVLAAPLPHGQGPETCLHLMSLLSILNERTVLVDLSWLAVETVEVLRGRGFRLIEMDCSERQSLACNVLALGNDTLLAFEENRSTNLRLQEAGFRVLTFPGGEIGMNGGGGPTCLTRPVLRALTAMQL
jgi:dimethylargininase